jgi:hypothetical protein
MPKKQHPIKTSSTTPSKSSRESRPVAPSSHRKANSALRPKPLPKILRSTPQYFIIDTVLPSHVVNDRSLFTTYAPSNRVHRTAFGTEFMIEGTGNVEVRVSAGGKRIIFTIHDCWHVPSSPHHFLSGLSVTSPSRGHHVMLSSRTPRLLFPQKHRLAEPNLPKYVPFARKGGYFVLNFDVPTQVSIPLFNPTTVHSATQTALSLQASLPCPFASLSFNRSSILLSQPCSSSLPEQPNVTRLTTPSPPTGSQSQCNPLLIPVSSELPPITTPQLISTTTTSVSHASHFEAAVSAACNELELENNMNCTLPLSFSPTCVHGGAIPPIHADGVLKMNVVIASHGGADFTSNGVEHNVSHGGVAFEDEASMLENTKASFRRFTPVSSPSFSTILTQAPQPPSPFPITVLPSPCSSSLDSSFSSPPSLNSSLNIPDPPPTILPSSFFSEPQVQLNPCSPLQSSSFTLRSIVSSIPLLHSDSNFFAWDEAVCTLLRSLGLYGHILDATMSLDPQPWSPDLLPAIKPELSQPPTSSESAAFNVWMENDNVAQYIITSRLGSIPRQLLPSAHGCRTALGLYTILSRHFGLRNFSRSATFANSLLFSTATPHRITNYVARWRAGVTRLHLVNFPISSRVYAYQFVKGVPPSLAFMTLRARLPHHLKNMKDDDIGAFISITDEVLDLATTGIFPVTGEIDG